ncbi:MAG: methylmalonyl-CoA mutase family protein, partial [Negativicutes bacterium]|nr:methylmalonyl-CoA mutase family protein [Negativicutes bacterium]
QQIVAYESGVADTIDPLAGSYAIESMTNRLEEEAWKYIEKIDEMGGAAVAIEKGYIQKEIQDAAYKFQVEVEQKKKIIVGVNQFQIEEPPVKGLLKVDPQIGIDQARRLKELRASRDNCAVQARLAALETACRDESVNVMPAILDAVRVYATLGEICGIMRKVFGEYRPPTVL